MQRFSTYTAVLILSVCTWLMLVGETRAEQGTAASGAARGATTGAISGAIGGLVS